jgi:hypothetical protein
MNINIIPATMTLATLNYVMILNLFSSKESVTDRYSLVMAE